MSYLKNKFSGVEEFEWIDCPEKVELKPAKLILHLKNGETLEKRFGGYNSAYCKFNEYTDKPTEGDMRYIYECFSGQTELLEFVEFYAHRVIMFLNDDVSVAVSDIERTEIKELKAATMFEINQRWTKIDRS